MPKYQHLPTVIEARELTRDSVDEILAWCGRATPCLSGMFVETLEGPHLARWGDYIANGVGDAFYPIKTEIFKLSYVEVKDDFEANEISEQGS